MIILSYTGSVSPLAVQPNYLESLGGFVSSSVIQNGEKNSLFSDVSSGESLVVRQAILIALTNVSNASISSITVYINSSSIENCLIKTSLVEGYVDNCQRLRFELLADSQGLPMYSDLQIHDQNNKINIPLMTSGKTLGLWLVRELTPQGVLKVKELTTCQALINKSLANFTLGEHVLKLDW